MFIKNLKVTNGKTGEIIRDISFKINGELKGLKLIVDNDEESASNNVGKSTVITSIDFCLGAKPEILFSGNGKSHSDSTIQNFLYENKITFQLVIEDLSLNTYTIERKFEVKTLKNGNIKKTTEWSLNGTLIKNNNLKGNIELKPIFFGESEEKTTFRQLIGKFLRDNSFSLSDPIRFYHNTTNKTEARLMLDRLFYHNTNSQNEETTLRATLKDITNIIARYKKDHRSISSLEEFIRKQEEEIQRFKDKISENSPVQVSEKHTVEYTHLIELSNEVSYLQSEVNSIKNSIHRYSNDRSKIDTNAVRILYNELKLYNDALSTTFDQTLEFHNSMLNSRIKYLEDLLRSKEEELNQKKNKRKECGIILNQNFADININLEDILSKKIHAEQNNKTLKEELMHWKDVESEKNRIESQINEITTTDDSSTINIFNQFLEHYTQEIYDERMYIEVPEEYAPYILKNVTNTGTGKEKGIITAFDLAYIAYINEINQKAPLFTAIDIFEPTDEPTIKKIFEIANSLNGQLIVPVLRSKIGFIENIDQYFVVQLNKNDKFFKIP
ncbi:MAG: DUF2326 domain-containing protein [Brevinema sp.]